MLSVPHALGTPLLTLKIQCCGSYYKDEVVALYTYVCTSHALAVLPAGLGEAESGFLQFQTSHRISVRVPELEA